MKKLITNFINHWFDRSVYMAGIVALIAILVPLSITQKLLLASIAVLFLHFFEEFGSPGGFPYMGREGSAGQGRERPEEMELQQPQFDVRQLAFLVLGLLPATVLPERPCADISGDDVHLRRTADAPYSFQCAPQSLL